MINTTNDLVRALARTQLHRETYIAALNGALSKRGAKQRFATQIGITPQYLSYLLDPWESRVASRDIAYKIVQNAPIQPDERGALLHHLLMSNPSNSFIDTSRITKMSRDDAILATEAIDLAQFTSHLKQDPEAVKQASRTTLRLGTWSMMRLDRRRSPDIYVKMASYMHNTACALNMPIRSLWYAKSSLATASEPRLWNAMPVSQRIASLVNGWRMLSVSYHNLGLAAKALEAVEVAHDLLDHSGIPELTKELTPHLVMEELNAYAISRRFSISAAEIAAEKGLNALGFGFEARKMRDLIGSLIQRDLVEAYISHGSKKSLRLAERRIYEVFTPDHLQVYGALTHTLHLRTGANLARKVGDYDSYRDWIGRAHHLATDAGLTHQLSEIEQETKTILI